MIQILRQLLFLNPFKGDIKVSRVWITRPSTRNSTLPFPNKKNYHQPLDILETFFARADKYQGDARHNRYLEVPGVSPVLVTRDPGVIRAILTATGDKDGQFDRDTMPSTGIARATGPDTLLFSNGPQWGKQRKASSRAFGKTGLFRADVFEDFEKTFRETVLGRIAELKAFFSASGKTEIEIRLEPEIKCVMMDMLLTNFFGAQIDREEIRNKYIPAIDRIIEFIVRDTIKHRFRFNPFSKKSLPQEQPEMKKDFDLFERLTDLSIEPRKSGEGAWARVDAELDESNLRSNVKVFLTWQIDHTVYPFINQPSDIGVMPLKTSIDLSQTTKFREEPGDKMPMEGFGVGLAACRGMRIAVRLAAYTPST